MIINSKRFGSLEVNEERIIHFKDGLLGFPEMKQWILADDPNDLSLPFKWLICIEQPDLAFLVTDPGIFFKDYVFDLAEEDRSKIGARTEDDISVITLLTVPADPKGITANLRGPLVINWRSLVGKQICLKDSPYTTKHYIFIQTPEEGKKSGLEAGASNSKTASVAGSSLSAAQSATQSAVAVKA